MLRIESLRKTYTEGSDPVLVDFNLEVKQREFVSLVGPSGCGKTTVLNIITGLVEPDAGSTIWIDGKPSEGPSHDKAMVFQHFNLFPWRNALNNVAYGLEMQGIPKKARLEAATEYLHMVGLGKYLNYYPGQLSGGMRQRVGLARALAIQPKVLLMDEPFGALDALTREQLHEMFMQIYEQQNLTVLFVTHSADEAIYLSDRIVVMGAGPGRVLAEFPVELPRPRRDYDWRARPEYTTVRNKMWELLQVSPEEVTA